ncbi:hypothetical protein SMSP2_00166 [Limihaloglobus sulfuriphilus]|uniref:Uncharacterized protein n=1 Tax=Limihaloglobus sulfuriphilus TaxID=1851148 RepID=A0A1Q2MC66_9BACT|nr:hypothetical protein [Limihaloglobus sulfuriphilus]AQQ69832.1 hypothetical protein SMSP2_00166 [Limihaloglobus sulfuriphilus]
MRKNVLLAMLLTAAAVGFSAPRPAMVPLPGIWTIETEFENLRPIMFSPDGSEPQRYWYMILSLTNNSPNTVPFYPSIELMTDTYFFCQANDFPAGAIFKQIRLVNQGKYPFLISYDDIDSSILKGSDNTVDIAVVFRDFDAEAKSLSIFIEGLSNETVTIEHPTKTDKDGNPLKVRLRKTLKLNYNLPGDNTAKQSRTLIFDSLEWVMR